MATTESRSGFRLPWAGDRRTEDPSDGALAPASNDETHAGDGAAEGDGERRNGTPASAGAGTVEGESVMATEIPTTDAAAPPAASVPPEPADSGPAPTRAAATAAAPASSVPSPAGPRKPAKFLADLTKAMRAAAEAERQETLEVFQLEAKSFVESIHGRSSTEADELRKRADDDVAAIREWSKQEIARIREETEQKISGRKSELSAEIEDHAGRIEREIERVHATVERYEQAMAAFFETLLAETDPTRFAVMAANLPEPPSFEALLAAGAADVPASAATADPAGETGDAAEMSDAAATSNAAATEDFTGQEATTAPEAAFAAEAATPMEPAGTEGLAGPEGLAGAERAPLPPSAQEPDRALEADTQTTDDATADSTDPRLAALGLADFAAAEAEASANLPSGDEEMSEVADPAFEARLAELAAGGADVAAARPTAVPAELPSAQTSVIVVGLVAVASIASFKRHLARVPGVRSVGVSSGPDGEFVFTVAHDQSVDLGEVVAVLPGFGARVTDAGAGFVRVSAHDADVDSDA